MKAKSILVVVLSLLYVLGLPTACRAGEVFTFERMWPTLKQPWYFAGPQGIAIDKDGNVYVADTNSHLIEKYSSDGTFITMWGTKVPGTASLPAPEQLPLIIIPTSMLLIHT